MAGLLRVFIIIDNAINTKYTSRLSLNIQFRKHLL